MTEILVRRAGTSWAVSRGSLVLGQRRTAPEAVGLAIVMALKTEETNPCRVVLEKGRSDRRVVWTAGATPAYGGREHAHR